MDATRIFVRVVGGAETKVELNCKSLRPGHDLCADAGDVASLIGLVGELLANATLQMDRADASYRNWKGQCVVQEMALDAKQAEWKVKAAIEALPEFLNHKNNIALANADIEFLRAFHDALRVKASMVRARVDLRTSEGFASKHGPDMRDAEDKTVEEQPIAQTRAEKLRAQMGKPVAVRTD